MADRTLLVVSQRPLDLGGGGSARWRHLCRELPRHGWHIVECSPQVGLTTNESSTDPRAAQRAARRAAVMGVAGRVVDPLARLLRLQPQALAPNNIWALTGRPRIRSAIKDAQPDVLLVTAPPPSALVAAAAVAGRVPLVAELRDLWAGNPYFDRGSSQLRALQARTLAHAAAVVTVSEGCYDILAAIDPQLARRVHVLPNGFDPELLKKRRDRPGAGGPRTLVHAGALYGERTAEALIAALCIGA